MFRGQSSHTIDPKGRIVIPARFREILRVGGGDSLMLTQMDACLYAYALEEWKLIEAKVMAMGEKNNTMRRFRRIFIGGAYQCNYDKQCRILVPPDLRKYAGLEKEIVMIGVLDHFEIWDRERSENENQQWELDSMKEDVRNEVAKLGL